MIYGDTVIDLQDHTIHEEALGCGDASRVFAGADALYRHPAKRVYHGHSRLHIFPL